MNESDTTIIDVKMCRGKKIMLQLLGTFVIPGSLPGLCPRPVHYMELRSVPIPPGSVPWTPLDTGNTAKKPSPRGRVP